MSQGPFGDDAFGRRAEKLARFFGTPRYILGQSAIVVAWIVLNSVGWVYHWDPRPWIMLNLVFSTQAAYAAPLILLAQTRQADRDKLHGEMVEIATPHSKKRRSGRATESSSYFSRTPRSRSRTRTSPSRSRS
jgi:hypothetical protein